ncbi:MAG TPA: NrfD/PsrC family molybdoenzyme membrane anchor subunit [Nitriliruptorales bacterium]
MLLLRRDRDGAAGQQRARPQKGLDLPLRDAALAPSILAGRGSTALLIVLAVPILAAAAAFGYQLDRGIGVTGLNDQVFWGVYTVNLVTFIGFSYGGALVSAILRLTNAHWRGPIVRLAEGTALVTLLVGAAFPIIHLGHPERVWQMFTRPQLNSPLLWDMVAIATYMLATLLLFVLPLIPDLATLQDHERLGLRRSRLYRALGMGWQGTPHQRASLERALTILAVTIIPVAIMVHTVLSYAFSLTSRPGWHSTIFGPYFVVAAVYSGVGIVIVAVVAYRRAYRLESWITERSIRSLGYIMVTLGAIYAYFLFTEITTEGYVGEEASQTLLHGLILGRYATLFWMFVAGGIVAPLLLVTVRRTRTVAGITTAALLVIVAMWLKRFLMFVPPLTRPLIGDQVGSYSPSVVELTITAGAVAAIPFLLIVLFRVVPVLSVYEIQELGHPALEPHRVPAGGEGR